jgi:hypothetical protein
MQLFLAPILSKSKPAAEAAGLLFDYVCERPFDRLQFD